MSSTSLGSAARLYFEVTGGISAQVFFADGEARNRGDRERRGELLRPTSQIRAMFWLSWATRYDHLPTSTLLPVVPVPESDA